MKSRSYISDPGNNIHLNKVKFQGDINLKQGVSIAFFRMSQEHRLNCKTTKIKFSFDGA